MCIRDRSLTSIVCSIDSEKKINPKRYCPICKRSELRIRTHKQVEIDQCESCWGAWFDCGEITVMLERKVDMPKAISKEAAIELSKAIAAYAKKADEKNKEELRLIKKFHGLSDLD